MKQNEIIEAVNATLDRVTHILVITDPLEIRKAMAANACLGVLWELYHNYLRGLIKHGEDAAMADAAEKIRDYLYQKMQDEGVNLDELYQ